MNAILRYLIILVFLIILPSICLLAQPGKRKLTWKQNLKIANQLIEQSSYYNATNYLGEALKSKPKHILLLHKMADTYRLARDYDNALIYYRKIKNSSVKKKEQDYPLWRYHYAQMLKRTGDYTTAKKELTTFLTISELGGNDRYKALVNNEINGCKMALNTELLPYAKNIELLNDEVNTGYTEYAPKPMNGKLVFSSLKGNKLVTPGQLYASSYRSEKEDTTGARWLKSESLPMPKFDGKEEHLGHVNYSGDGERMYFTKCPSQKNNQVKCKIYICERDQNSWATPKLLDNGINELGSESSSPTITHINGKEYLFFSSNKKGGKGGVDIWMSYRNINGNYTEAVNLKNINTEGDEVTPYYDKNIDSLYFSSNGHPSFGGFDIFRVAFNNKKEWGSPENMRKPINSTADDLYFVKESSSLGYIVSNRPGGLQVASSTCCDDIFKINLIQEKIIQLELTGLVYLQNHYGDNRLTNDATVTIFRQEVNQEKGGDQREIVPISSQDKGYFVNLVPDKKYELLVTSEGYLPRKITINTEGYKENTRINKNVVLEPEGLLLTGFVFGNDGQTDDVLEEAEIAVYRKNLETGKRELIGKDISNPKGYEVFLRTGEDFEVVASKDGFLGETYEFTTKGLEGRPVSKKDIVLKLKKKNIAFRIDNIHYDSNSSELRSKSKSALDLLVTTLNNNPNIIIELSSHTDGNGTDKYNLSLSQKRADKAVNYLIGRGINPSRLVAKGYGESKMIAIEKHPNGSDNPAGRQLNRRTEFKIIGELSHTMK